MENDGLIAFPYITVAISSTLMLLNLFSHNDTLRVASHAANTMSGVLIYKVNI